MLSVINTIIKYEKILHKKEVIKVLDAGCGNGMMIYFLQKYLPLLNKEKKFLIYGFDVVDHGVQEKGYESKTFSYLKTKVPEIDWTKRIHLIQSNEDWPFENGFFDFVISNQVIEHVLDHNQFFRQQYRVLNDKGFSHHILPLREVIVDGHIFLPKVHKLNSWDAIYKRILFYSKLGLGSYRISKKNYNYDKYYFSKVWADKIYHYCNYQSYTEIAKIAKNNHLSLTTRFTYEYYRRKIHEVFGKTPDLIYKYRASSKIIFFVSKYISGISLTLYKGEYSKY